MSAWIKPLLLALVLPQGNSPLPDAGALLKSVSGTQQAGYQNAKGDKAAIEALATAAKSQATQAIAGVDFTKIPDGQLDDWASLFRLAGKTDEATTLSEKAVRYHAMKAWDAQNQLLQVYLQRGDKIKILDTLDNAIGLDVPMLGQVGEFVVFPLTGKYGATDPEFVLKAYHILLQRVAALSPSSDAQKSWKLFGVARMSANRDALLYRMGREKEALADLKRVRTASLGDDRALQAVDEVGNQLASTGKPAQEILASRQIGSYKSLSALRGKVVLVDFFAHWCGPCKKAFPAMRELYAANKDKGLEVVGVTSLQGYYADQKDLKPDAEFALMRDKFVPEFNLPWPIVFEKDKAASKAYGVSGIPHMVIIDRNGKIRRIVVGYTPDEFAQTKTLVNKLLSE